MLKIKIQRLTAENTSGENSDLSFNCEKDYLVSPLINDEASFRIKVTELSEDSRLK
jgi:hypothetical protein